MNTTKYLSQASQAGGIPLDRRGPFTATSKQASHGIADVRAYHEREDRLL